MPRRRSSRGGLAAALRHDEDMEVLKTLAEFTEPYGTLAAADRIYEGEADAWDYLAAIPVLGGVARAGKAVSKVGDYADGLRSFDPRFDPRVKERERIEGLDTEVQNQRIGEIPEVNLAEFEGRPFVTSMSDRTAAGGELAAINQTQLNQPVNLRGGQDFMFDPVNEGQVWASAPTPVNQITRLAQELRGRTGEDPLFMPWRMAPTGGDFASMTGETMIGYASAAMNKTNKKKLDKTIGALIPGWKGVDDPDSIAQFRAAPDRVRKQLKNEMDVSFRDAGGLNIGEARLAVTDPTQVNAPDAGLQNVGVIRETDSLGLSSHPSYPNAVPGEGVGRLADPPLVTELLGEGTVTGGPRGAFEDLDFTGGRGSDPSAPSAQDVRALQMKPYGGVIDDKLLKRLQEAGYTVGTTAFAAALLRAQEDEEEIY